MRLSPRLSFCKNKKERATERGNFRNQLKEPPLILGITKKRFTLLAACFCSAISLARPGIANPDFDDWLQQEQEAFDTFIAAHDQAFLEHLEKEWKAFAVFQGDFQDNTPKVLRPPLPPVERNNALILSDIVTDQAEPAVVRIRDRKSHYKSSVQSFYGHYLEALLPPVTQLPDLENPSNRDIRKAWSQLAAKDHSEMLAQISNAKDALGLGDWGLVQLIDYLLEPSIDEDNQRVIYSWFVLNQLGYDAKLGMSNRTVVLLIPSLDKLYGVGYTEIAGSTYYILSRAPYTKIYTYDGKSAYRPQAQNFEFSLNSLMARSNNTVTLSFQFSHPQSPRDIDITFDAGISELLADYPQLELHQYFLPHPGQPTAGSLRNQLKPLLAELSQREALEILLALSQHLFQYQTDQQQFNQEKYLLIEESLYYGINDCEDRSIFLAWLTRELLDAELVVLDYPGHVALAVRTEIKPDDDIIEYDNRKFVVMDPTYIGARVGMAMPDVQNVQPTIMSIGTAI